MKRIFIPLLLCVLTIYACKDQKTETPAENEQEQITEEQPEGPFFKISLAQWSLHKEVFDGKTSAMQFAADAKGMGIDAIEYVSFLYDAEIEKLGMQAVLDSLKNEAERHQVSSLLIMVDNEGDLADEDEATRDQAVENHKKWVDAAAYLGAHSIRVNTFGTNNPEAWVPAVTDGLKKLSEYAATKNINVLIENHGWMSSDADKVMEAIAAVGMDNCGTLPDFGNWCIKRKDGERWGECEQEYPDIYKGTELLMGAAKAVSAKSYDFTDDGGQAKLDYVRLLQIVKDAGYTGHIGIEYEGNNLPEREGIAATKALMLSAAEQLK